MPEEWPLNADFKVPAGQRAAMYNEPGGRRVAVVPGGTVLHGVAEVVGQGQEADEALWLRIDLAEKNPLRSAHGLSRCWVRASDGAASDVLEWQGPLDADVFQGTFHLRWSPPVCTSCDARYAVEVKAEGDSEWRVLWSSRDPRAAEQVDRQDPCISMRVTWPHCSKRAAVRVATHIMPQVHGARPWVLRSSPFTVCADLLEQSTPIDAESGTELALRPALVPEPVTVATEGPGSQQLWPPPQLPRPSVLAKVLWMNLDRRADRAQTQQEALHRAGLASIAERFPAVDGRAIDLQEVDEEILTQKGRAEALAAPDFVLGRVLTAGAVGLWMTWHRLLMQIRDPAQPHGCYLVVEDDAEYAPCFLERLSEVLAALDMREPAWKACAVGYIRSKSRMRPIFGERASDSSETLLDTPIGIPSKLCGATAVLVHGAAGADALLRVLFPVQAGGQFDLCLGVREGLCYISAAPLASAPLSEAGDSDIQRIPAGRQAHYRLEALIRQQLGDSVFAAQPELADVIGVASFTEELLSALTATAIDDGDAGATDASSRSTGSGPLKPDRLKAIAEGIGAWAAAKNNGRTAPKIEGSAKVRWSLSGPFSLVGSWDDWARMHPMLPTGAGGFRGAVDLPEGAAWVEFQVLFGGDWARRFCPESKDPFFAPVGPADLHGLNWRAKVPRSCRRLRVAWHPAGMRRLALDFER